MLRSPLSLVDLVLDELGFPMLQDAVTISRVLFSQAAEGWNGEKDINTPLLLLKRHLHNDAWE